MPSINSITYNGIINEYYFDTWTRKHKIKYRNKMDDESMLFYPTYCYAKIKKMVFDTEIKINDNDREYYMTIGSIQILSKMNLGENI